MLIYEKQSLYCWRQLVLCAGHIVQFRVYTPLMYVYYAQIKQCVNSRIANEEEHYIGDNVIIEEHSTRSTKQTV